MQQNNSPDRALTWGLVALTALAAMGLRLGSAWNIGAVGALSLYAGGRLRWWQAWVPPIAVMAVIDCYLWRTHAWAPFDPWVYGSVLVYVLLGRLLTGSRSPWRIGAATALGSLQFFLVTNFGTWYSHHGLATPLYPRTLDGLVECYTMGLPFLKYTLIGDLGFTAAVFAAEAWLSQRVAEPAAEEVRA